MSIQTRTHIHRSKSPLTSRKENVTIIPRSQSPMITKQDIAMTKFYNRFYRQEQRFRLLQEEIQSEIKAKANSKKITENSYRIIAHYLQQRIQHSLDTITTQSISFAQLGTIFTILNVFDSIQFNEEYKLIVKDKSNVSNRARQEMIMHEYFWNLIANQGKSEEVDRQVVSYFLRVLLDPVKLEIDDTAEMLLDMVEYDVADQYQQTKELAIRLVKQFRSLTQSKLFTVHSDRKVQEEHKYKEQILRELTFTPKICHKSQILAQQNRQKYIIENTEVDVALFGDSIQTNSSPSFISVMQKKDELLKDKRQQLAYQSQQDKLKECTFHPKINQRPLNKFDSSKSDIVQRLYQEESIVNKRQFQEENARIASEMRERNELRECTFQPNVNEGIPFTSSQTPRDYERTVGRMRYALEQNRIKKDMEDYVPSGQNYHRNKCQQFKPPQMVTRQQIKRKPIVIMDVNICPGKQGRLALYEDDNPEDAVRNFARLFKLNQEMQDTLLSVLEQERSKHFESIEQ